MNWVTANDKMNAQRIQGDNWHRKCQSCNLSPCVYAHLASKNAVVYTQQMIAMMQDNEHVGYHGNGKGRR